MESRQLEKGSILDTWGDVIEILNSIEGLDRVTNERELRRRLRENLPLGKRGNVGILDPKARGECARFLLVPCSSTNFYERVFDVLDIARYCNLRPGVKLEGVMFLPVSWTQSCEERLATHVSSMLRNYSVVQTCVKFPLSTFPRCWR